jgi:hypothetical protein
MYPQYNNNKMGKGNLKNEENGTQRSKMAFPFI